MSNRALYLSLALGALLLALKLTGHIPECPWAIVLMPFWCPVYLIVRAGEP